MTWLLEASSGAVPVWAAKFCDDGVGVVLAAVMDGHPYAKGGGASRCWTLWWPMPWERLAGR